MEKRTLGKTEERLSVIGFGGLVMKNETAGDASRYVSTAIDRSINYFDVGPEYGNAQEILGPALEPFRDKVFLACKTHAITAEDAERELYDSLKKLRTDHFDLYQLHEVLSLDDVDRIMGPGGAIEFFVRAKEKGIIKYIGFATHVEEVAIALMDAYDFTSIMFPFNWALWFKNNYGPSVLTKAKEKEMGILAIKGLAKGALGKDEKRKWKKCWYAPLDDYEEASQALRFTLSLPVTSALSPSHAELLWLGCDVADNSTTISEEEKEILKNRAQSTDTLVQDPAGFNIQWPINK
jgi:predicted aldo/keto reductase-like oxidoreductase